MSVCPCCDVPWQWYYPTPVVTDEDVPWTGGQADKLYLQSGEFSSTVKTSVVPPTYIPSFRPIYGHSFDGVDTYFTDSIYDVTTGGEWLRRISGQFTTTTKDSQKTYIPPEDLSRVSGICWDGTNTGCTLISSYVPPAHTGKDAFVLYSGNFTSTVKTSLSFSYTYGNPIQFDSMSWDGVDTYTHAQISAKHYIYSGQYTSTVKVSLADQGSSSDSGICWNGTNTLITTLYGSDAKLTRMSGKLTSTLQTSQSVYSVDTSPLALNTNRTTTG